MEIFIDFISNEEFIDKNHLYIILNVIQNLYLKVFSTQNLKGDKSFCCESNNSESSKYFYPTVIVLEKIINNKFGCASFLIYQ